jgi:hypothetical protein
MDVRQATQLETDIDQALAHCDLDRAEELASRYRTIASAEASNGDPAHSLTFRSNYLAAQVALAGGRLWLAVQRLAALMPFPEACLRHGPAGSGCCPPRRWRARGVTRRHGIIWTGPGQLLPR